MKAFIEDWSEAASPALYATLKRDFSGRGSDGAVKVLLTGQRVRLTFVTGCGDNHNTVRNRTFDCIFFDCVFAARKRTVGAQAQVDHSCAVGNRVVDSAHFIDVG